VIESRRKPKRYELYERKDWAEIHKFVPKPFIAREAPWFVKVNKFERM